MVVKPGKEEILETYSLRELLDLVEQKSLQNTQDVINDIRDNLASLRFEPEVSNALSTASSTVEKSTQIRSKRNPEPAKAMRQEERLSPASGPGRGRVKGGASLSSLVMSILGSAPKTVDDILGQLEKKGWSLFCGSSWSGLSAAGEPDQKGCKRWSWTICPGIDLHKSRIYFLK